MEGPIPTFLKALGQVPQLPYGERPIPVLFEALCMKLPPRDLNLGACPPYLTGTYTCGGIC